jgi:hypothetical protein
LGVLGQDKGPTFAPVAYLSKKLDPTVQGWAPCLRALSVAYVLVQESKKLTFGGTITIVSPHHLAELLTYKGLRTLPPCWILSLLFSFLHCSLCLLLLKPCHPLAHLYHHAYPLLHLDPGGPSPLPFTHPGRAPTGLHLYLVH